MLNEDFDSDENRKKNELNWLSYLISFPQAFSILKLVIFYQKSGFYGKIWEK
jgi:hypothetical protein